MAEHRTCLLADLQTNINAIANGTLGDDSTIEVTNSGTLAAKVTFPAPLRYFRMFVATGQACTIAIGTNVLELLHSGSDDARDIAVEGFTLKHTPAGANATLAKVNGVNASLLLDRCHIWGAGITGHIFAPSAAGLHTGTMRMQNCTYQGAFAQVAYGGVGMADIQMYRCNTLGATWSDYLLYGNTWGFDFQECRYAARGVVEGLNAFSPVVSKAAMPACEFRKTVDAVDVLHILTFTGVTIDLRKTLFVGDQGTGAAGTCVRLDAGVPASKVDARGACFVGWGNPAVTSVNLQTLTRAAFYNNTADVGGAAAKGAGCVATDPGFVDPGEEWVSECHVGYELIVGWSLSVLQ